jgi:hypothetical protein
MIPKIPLDNSYLIGYNQSQFYRPVRPTNAVPNPERHDSVPNRESDVVRHLGTIERRLKSHRIVLKCAQNVSPFAVTPLESALTKKQGGGGYLSLNKINLQIFPNLELRRRVKRSTQNQESSAPACLPRHRDDAVIHSPHFGLGRSHFTFGGFH